MKSAPIWTYLLCLPPLAICQAPQDDQDVVAALQKSHIEANVPPAKVFDQFLKRDLNTYFCQDSKDCKVKYEFLRNGPTQVGISYPKYYLWVKTIKKGTVVNEGAARIAAVEQKRFDVKDYLSREEISQSPSLVASIFPSALLNKIAGKAHGAK